MTFRFLLPCICASALASLAACAATSPDPQMPHGAAPSQAKRASTGLGPVLTDSDAGEIFGFDIDQNGDDGVLASWAGADISVQAFDTQTAKITKTFGVITGKRVEKGDDYVVDGIFAGDVGLVDFQKAGIPGQTATKDLYHIVNPVTHGDLNGRWKPPLKLFDVTQWAENQSTMTSVVYGYQREGSDDPSLLVSDVAKGSFSKVTRSARPISRWVPFHSWQKIRSRIGRSWRARRLAARLAVHRRIFGRSICRRQRFPILPAWRAPD